MCTYYNTLRSMEFKRDSLTEFGTRWASPVRVSFHARGDYDVKTGVEMNGLMLSFITEVSWMRKNGYPR
jgi:hypothetical protein